MYRGKYHIMRNINWIMIAIIIGTGIAVFVGLYHPIDKSTGGEIKNATVSTADTYADQISTAVDRFSNSVDSLTHPDTH